MHSARVADTTEVDGNGVTIKVNGGLLKGSHDMIVAIPAIFGVWVGNHHDRTRWILIRTHHIAFNSDSIKGFQVNGFCSHRLRRYRAYVV